MIVLATLSIILFLAFLVEALVEYVFGQIAEHVEALRPWQWLLTYVALAVGILAAFVYHFDLVYLLAQFLDQYAPGVINAVPQTTIGVVLTGLAIGRGSSFIHDIMTRFFVKPAPEPSPVTINLGEPLPALETASGESVGPVTPCVNSKPQ